MDLGVDVSERNGFTVVSVMGEMDVYTAPQFRQRLVEVLTQGKSRIVVDLEGLEFIDSTGLGVLVGALKRARNQDGDIELVLTKPAIARVFEITGLTKVFAIHTTVDEAVGAGVTPGDL